ncbi:hypothetical protein S2091_4342 [Solimicrobium silvestre]|uniref:Uncharacterized protein n=1 Tax=Solimicrobium silvestre TaxID=2099400 RepID=A0A2S9GTB4_9BURK|nr:hypothetical protein S2091_4342 [Solimicrobium silvestre]
MSADHKLNNFTKKRKKYRQSLTDKKYGKYIQPNTSAHYIYSAFSVKQIFPRFTISGKYLHHNQQILPLGN